MKKGISFLLFTQLWLVGYANKQSYCENLLELSKKEIESKNYAKSLEYLMEAKIYAKEHDMYDIQINILNKMGNVYADISNYEKAMECYLEAHQIVLSRLDNKRGIGILNNIARLYFLSDNMDKATEYIEKAYKIAVEQKDSTMMLILLNNMGTISNKKGNLEQTENYLNIAMEIVNQNPQDLLGAANILPVKAEYLYLKGEYDLAEQLVLKVLNWDIENWDSELKVEYLLMLSKIYYQKKNFEKAISFAKEALRNNFDLPMNIEIYEHLSNIYRSGNSSSLVLQYQDSAMIMKDSLIKLNNMSRILSGQIQFDLSNLEKKLAENKEKQKRERMLFTFIIVFIVICIIVFLLISRTRSTKNKQLKIIAELELEKQVNERLLLEQQLKEQETLALMEMKMYKNEIELKNKQLVSQTLFQLNKNELIEEIIQALFHIPNQSESRELQHIIKKLKSQIKEPAGWDSFLTYFEQTNPTFLSSLKKKHPDLTANEIRLSSYIYLNLDTKEISKLLNITIESCRKKKQRLAQKLELPSTKIYGYLSNIV